MTNNVSKNYSEVYEILNLLGKKYIEKIPKKLYDFFEEERDKNYSKNLNFNDFENDFDIDENTLTIIAYLYLQYWYESEDEKKELLKTFKENDIKFEKELRERYNPDKLFKNRNIKDNIDESIETKQANIIEYKETIFKKILNKLKRLFKINR